jgi:hypothetical protein
MSLWEFPWVDTLDGQYHMASKTFTEDRLWECDDCPCSCRVDLPSSFLFTIIDFGGTNTWSGPITNNTPSCRGQAPCIWTGNVPHTAGPSTIPYWNVDVVQFKAFPPIAPNDKVEIRRWEIGSSACDFGISDGYPCCAVGHYLEVISEPDSSPVGTYTIGAGGNTFIIS